MTSFPACLNRISKFVIKILMFDDLGTQNLPRGKGQELRRQVCPSLRCPLRCLQQPPTLSF